MCDDDAAICRRSITFFKKIDRSAYWDTCRIFAPEGAVVLNGHHPFPDEWLYMGLLYFWRLDPFILSHRHCLSVHYAVNRQRLQGWVSLHVFFLSTFNLVVFICVCYVDDPYYLSTTFIFTVHVLEAFTHNLPTVHICGGAFLADGDWYNPVSGRSVHYISCNPFF